ncbi:MAG: alpha/beta hydrolase [Acidimicrobiales bacterium]|nr:alpha/beta hydrolase [Acidimicrobiales bacterium]
MSDDIDIGPIEIVTDDGLTLHGDLVVPPGTGAVAVVCHPHPRMGGDRHNTVVDAVFRGLAVTGVAVVRFDFRGVGRSEGTFGSGVDERLDASAALGTAAALAPGTPLWSIGYSFGGDVALSSDHPDLTGWVAIAAPLSVIADDPAAATDDRPTTLVVPAHDQFRPPAAARDASAGWGATTVVEIDMADHFLTGRLAAAVDAVVEAVTPA